MLLVPLEIALAILHHKVVFPKPPSPPITVIVPSGIYPGTSHFTNSFLLNPQTLVSLL